MFSFNALQNAVVWKVRPEVVASLALRVGTEPSEDSDAKIRFE